MNISLFCNSGMSTSIMAQKLQAAYDAAGIEHLVEAYDYSSLPDVAEDTQIIILGPQIAWAQEDVERDYPDKIVLTLGIQEFGNMNGENLKSRIDELMAN
ncbi:transcription antiterminator [Superficieibacter electus]|uniref:Transcription antiterminator n=1 Tax=Superficieibacter electus TaxID=2022662 RepID=A0A2P5GH73_9ENTR|nr:transcription antiterminator [Superficieibacter electus]POP40602.1 transcription antiterminator [Superficieibacter electus]POP41671.1 transcription antiterminator [Superficieibacter electus]